ncbi:hypothetical protein [Parafrankia discariae]|uniref:hypothetical protein n=1 Tax=Parafrankia discariae TaxID=365528 RepID=UPI0003795C7C|nr:hypothetical protein [Parafrankia discariae]
MTDQERDDTWGTERELLLVLGPDPEAARAALELIADWGRVTARLPPRLALVVLPSERIGPTGGLAGVAGVLTADVPPALRETLAPDEGLFVDGWLARARRKPARPGEGRRWDDPAAPGGPPR